MTLTRIEPPRSWLNPPGHYRDVLVSPWYRAIARLQSAVISSTAEFWSARDIAALGLPITTGSISSPMGAGSDSLPVQVEIAGVETYLADSMQLLLEYGCRVIDAGCYYVMSSFRGEDEDVRHLPQFIHSEAELLGGLDDVIDVVEDYVCFLAHALLDRFADDIAAVCGTVDHVERLALRERFPRVTLDEAVDMLGNDPEAIVFDPSGWRAITPHGERRLLREVDEVVWLTHADHLAVPFYQAFDDPTRLVARNADLLLGIGEVIGCGERHRTGADLRAALQLHQVDPSAYAWYVDMKDTHPLQTAGFGMGIERFLLWVVDHDDIRDVPLVLRFNGRDIAP